MARYKKKSLPAEAAERTAISAPNKMLLLFTIVNREKTEFYVDLLQNFEINMQMILSASGTAGSETLSLLGIMDSKKSVIISTVRQDKAKEALAMLDQKFKTVRNGKGVAYTIPLKSTIGVAIYQFISNQS